MSLLRLETGQSVGDLQQPRERLSDRSSDGHDPAGQARRYHPHPVHDQDSPDELPWWHEDAGKAPRTPKNACLPTFDYLVSLGLVPGVGIRQPPPRIYGTRRSRAPLAPAPAGLRVRLPPRRTERIRTGCRPGHHRALVMPSENDLRRLVDGSGRHDKRQPALIALLAFSAKGLGELLALQPAELYAFRLPFWGWWAVLRLLHERARRGVWQSPLLFSTFREGQARPLHIRDAERAFARHQRRRGFWTPFTVTAIRRRFNRPTTQPTERISLDRMLRRCVGTCERLRREGALWRLEDQ